MYNTYNIQKCVNWPFKFAVKLSSWLWVVKFGEGQKLYAGFQLCEELAPLTPEFFKGWLYFLFLVLSESFSLYSPKTISVILPVLLCAWPAHLNMYELFKHPPGWGGLREEGRQLTRSSTSFYWPEDVIITGLVHLQVKIDVERIEGLFGSSFKTQHSNLVAGSQDSKARI